MSSPVIIDTSVWSLALGRAVKPTSLSERSLAFLLKDLIVAGRAVLLGVVRQEILTGITNPRIFESTRDYLHDFDDFAPDIDDYERAALYANQCRSKGIAAPTVDILICSVAVGYDLSILTTDRDFMHYAQYLPIKLHPHA
jgi:predicted nucleic acid-binding protein